MKTNTERSCDNCRYNNEGWCSREGKPVGDGAQSPGFVFPETHFAATCGDCYYNDGGWCRKGGGWRDADRWACSDYA